MRPLTRVSYDFFHSVLHGSCSRGCRRQLVLESSRKGVTLDLSLAHGGGLTAVVEFPIVVETLCVSRWSPGSPPAVAGAHVTLAQAELKLGLGGLQT